MRRQRGLVRLVGLATLVGLGIAAKPAVATVTTERSASILVFPKVIADGTRDTIIQITNTSNNMRHAHCFYVNGALTDPSAPQSDLNPPLWTETDFDIWLTKQQPTHWVASTGRLLNPADATCRSTTCDPSSSGGDHADCCDAGQDPGHVPPVGPDFTGELKCIETEATDMPVSGNSLKGEATIVESATNDVSKYNAIGLQGFDTNTGDGVLCIGGDVSDACPRGAEYAACPDTWMLDHPLVGSEDPVVAQADCGEGTCTSSVSANLTVVPCSEDFEHQSPPPVLLSFLVTNEFEQTFSFDDLPVLAVVQSRGHQQQLHQRHRRQRRGEPRAVSRCRSQSARLRNNGGAGGNARADRYARGDHHAHRSGCREWTRELHGSDGAGPVDHPR
jgi:hypothetical protein